jgi:hypothetical protein
MIKTAANGSVEDVEMSIVEVGQREYVEMCYRSWPAKKTCENAPLLLYIYSIWRKSTRSNGSAGLLLVRAGGPNLILNF